MSVATNESQLVQIAVTGNISQPTLRYPGYTLNDKGVGQVLPGMSGVVYNARVGDPAFGWAADHVEPGVSIANPESAGDFALHYLTCIGNTAVVTSGLAKGAKGIVTGEHARLLVDFPPDVNDLLCVGDSIQIIAHGRGLAINDFPQIELKKCSPQLVNNIPFKVLDRNRIQVPVTTVLPPRIMGSGAELNSEYVDQDLMSGDRALMAELGIDKMRLGDLVVIPDADHRYGRTYRKGAVTIALCIHGDSVMIGHGPGILTLMTCPEPCIEWVIDPTANIANYLNIRELA
ncbi:MAG: DUF4438 domain-containing protein [Anaerolineae bacterium]|nr:DUF4438 domain-containing protein [Anaerolineae bacterium]MBN8618763.1 DUF4438 domain-containing protein [Anaerolineae bacterium]